MSDPVDADLVLTADDEEAEVVDALPVVADERPRDVQPARPALPVVAQAAAVATTAFAAGAVTAAVVRRHRGHKSARRRRKDGVRLADVVGTRSFLVDVHLLGSDE